MGGGGGHMGMGEGRGMLAGGHKPSKMRHIHMQIGTDRICDLAHAGKVDLPRHRRAAGDDQLWLMVGGQRGHFIIINQVVLFAHAVLHRVEPFARLVGPRPMGQMAARI